MSGLGEILEENTRLRDLVRERDGLLAAQAEQLAVLASKVEALETSNERFAQHFEFLEKRRQMAAAERMASVERQSPLFDGLEVDAPPRDPELEKKGEGDEKTDGRTTAKHPRKGRRDVSALPFPRVVPSRETTPPGGRCVPGSHPGSREPVPVEPAGMALA